MVTLDGFTARLDYPMYVVTATAADGERSGCLVGFASQCSIHPVRFVVWLSKENHTYGVARRATHLAVHLLDRDRHELAALFGGRTGDRTDKFAGVRWRPGPHGVPLLLDSSAWFVGRVQGFADWGDHVGFLLDPEAEGGAPGRSGKPLLGLGDVSGLEPGHPA